ncbi:MAG: hypothetical protein K2N60_08610, partial [Oscillospiraceae bacterium]|nr:hypothetical protein [Oscillospiraceae bacterium]
STPAATETRKETIKSVTIAIGFTSFRLGAGVGSNRIIPQSVGYCQIGGQRKYISIPQNRNNIQQNQEIGKNA